MRLLYLGLCLLAVASAYDDFYDSDNDEDYNWFWNCKYSFM